MFKFRSLLPLLLCGALFSFAPSLAWAQGANENAGGIPTQQNERAQAATVVSEVNEGEADASESSSSGAVDSSSSEASGSGDSATSESNSVTAATGESGYEVDVSATGTSARIEGVNWAIDGFQRSQTGSNRAIDGVVYGYTYRVDSNVMLMVVNTDQYAVVYVPETYLAEFNFDLTQNETQLILKDYLIPLDEGLSMGSTTLASQNTWYFTSDTTYQVGDLTYEFGRELVAGKYYVVISAPDSINIKEEVGPRQMDSALLVASSEATIEGEAGFFEQVATFLSTVDLSPLWVTLKTCGVAIIFVFILGLAAAYFTLKIPKRAQSIFDTIFTIPMVLPPTVCGFLLLMLLGKNTALGRFFQSIDFSLVFSWQATVIAAVVVAFPLMYRSARGAFEGLDPNMLDAARTLGWSNRRIFVKLMMPLAWSSIASGTVLAFARALGEFGCTLFLAGNQLGSTRTIPIAIYFEWMNGNTEATWFWTIVLIVFSFLVILFINVWSRRTTRYRVKDVK